MYVSIIVHLVRGNTHDWCGVSGGVATGTAESKDSDDLTCGDPIVVRKSNTSRKT